MQSSLRASTLDGMPPPHAADWRALIQTSIQISRSLDLTHILETSLAGIQHVTHSDQGCFLLLDPATRAIQVAPVESLSPALADRFHAIEFAQIAGQIPASELIYGLGDRVRAALEACGIVEYVMIPLTTRSSAVGILWTGLRTPTPLAPPSVDFLMALGEQIGMAIDNARLHERVRDSEEWHRTLIANSADGIWEGDFADRILFVNDAACAIMGGDRATILQTPMSFFASDPVDDRRASAVELYQTGVLQSRPSKLRRLDGTIVPINYTTRLVRDENGRPTRYQTIFRDMSVQYRLIETLSHRNAELGALNAIAEILSHVLENENALNEVCQQITTITGMETVVIDLLDEACHEVGIVAWYGLSDELIRVSRHLGLDDAVTRQIAIEGQVIAMDDLQNYPGEGFAGPRAEGYRAGIAVPIRRGNKPLGMLIVGSKAKTQYERSDVDLLRNVANQIGVALENVDLLKQMTRRMAELDGLARLSAACASSLDPQTIFASTLYWTQTLLNVDGADLRLVNGDQVIPVPTGSRGYKLGYDCPVTLIELRPLLLERRAPFVANNVREYPGMPPAIRQAFETAEVGAILGIPIVAQDRVIGLLVALRRAPYIWSPHEIELLKTIANQTANALDSANLFQSVLSEQRKVEAIFDSGLGGLYTTDAAGNLTMFNRAAEHITGWARTDALSQTWHTLFASPNVPYEQSLIAQVQATRDTVYILEGGKIHTRLGAEISVAQAGAPLFDENGNLTGIVGAFWDLSREKQAEMTREHLLAMFAHELSSPITSITSAIEMLERRTLNPARRREMLSIIKTEGARLKRFAHQFLDMEGAFASPRPVKLRAIVIDPIAQNVMRRFRAEDRAHTLRFQRARPTPIVIADPERVDHILTNLVDNAINYSPPGTRVTISIRPWDETWAVIAVQDQGDGIAADEHELIFERFYRSKRAPQPRVYGHGLGLAIVREMVTEMGGKIWVESREKQGAIFRFTLRRVQ